MNGELLVVGDEDVQIAVVVKVKEDDAATLSEVVCADL